MLFNSYAFIFVFLPLVFCGYFALQYFECKKAMAGSGNGTDEKAGSGILARAFLVIASLFFYSYYNVIYLPLILASIGVNFLIGTRLGKMSSQTAEGTRMDVAGGGAG